MLPQMISTVAQVAAAGPNWVTLGIVFGVMVLILIVILVIPNGVSPEAIEGDKKDRKALEDKTARKALTDGETDKEKMSLAEIKESKRAAVGEDKSKEERRELRKERRAATQTANAIHEREESGAKTEEKKSEEAAVEAVKAEEKKSDEVKAEAVKSDEVKAETAKSEAAKAEESKPSAAEIFAADEQLGKVDTDAGDIFASLFGDSDPSKLDLDDLTETPKPTEGTVFPSLGSALIPLTEVQKDEEEGVDVLSELAKRFENQSEKKTP